ncbi:hypothetical protein [uncultured Chitinophaga sp.]|uniref:hypothetical protein n=1 Tax=uncultured Chitinophaga sp. TaxID=339340 RepID=UPI0025F4D590|nr:hypothetical protein [uncultured Chitinophaga sp.]
MNAQNRSIKLLLYFYAFRLRALGLVMVLSLLLFGLLSNSFAAGMDGSVLFLMLFLGVPLAYWLVIGHYAPTDQTVDNWLQEDVKKIIEQSYERLGMDRTEEVREPLVIISPVYWKLEGVSLKEMVFRKGKDKMLRFSIYQVTIFHMQEQLTGAYICHYNFMRNGALYEKTSEYHYKDIVSVSTQQAIVKYHLPEGIKLIHVKEFGLSVASGESIKVVIALDTIAEREKAQLRPTGAEQAVNVIRGMLRLKKA